MAHPFEGDLHDLAACTRKGSRECGGYAYSSAHLTATEANLRVHLDDVDAVEVLGSLDLVRVRVEGLGFERVGQGARVEG